VEGVANGNTEAVARAPEPVADPSPAPVVSPTTELKGTAPRIVPEPPSTPILSRVPSDRGTGPGSPACFSWGKHGHLSEIPKDPNGQMSFQHLAFIMEVLTVERINSIISKCQAADRVNFKDVPARGSKCVRLEGLVRCRPSQCSSAAGLLNWMVAETTIIAKTDLETMAEKLSVPRRGNAQELCKKLIDLCEKGRSNAGGSRTVPGISCAFARPANNYLNSDKECKSITEIFEGSSRYNLGHHKVGATEEDIRDMVRSASQKNTKVLHIGAHCRDGMVLHDPSSDSSKEMRIHDFRKLLEVALESNSVIECVFLNMCGGGVQNLAHMLSQKLSVVCWEGDVDDTACLLFAEEFYKTLEKNPGDYKRSFKYAENKLELEQQKQHDPEKPLKGNPLFKTKEDSLCDTESDSSDDEPDSSPVSRGAGALRGKFDFPRLAGRNEKECLRHLGFDVAVVDKSCMCGCGSKKLEYGGDDGHGLTNEGRVTKTVVSHLSNGEVESYGRLWGANGVVVQKASQLVDEKAFAVPLSRLRDAICDRQRDMLSWREAKSKTPPQKPPGDGIRAEKASIFPDILMRRVAEDVKDRKALKSSRNTVSVSESKRKELQSDDKGHSSILHALFTAYNSLMRRRDEQLENRLSRMNI